MSHTPPDYDNIENGPTEHPFRSSASTDPYLGSPAERATAWSSTTSSHPSPSTTEVAEDEAATVKNTAVDAGKNVAATAKDEAANVVADTKAQAQRLLGSVTSEIRSQAGTQQQKIAASVQSLSQELTGMASDSAESGPLTGLARQAADKGGEIAEWLQDREPRDVLDEVRSFARRKPITFLVLCGVAGVVAGRLTRGAVAANTSIDAPSSTAPTPAAVETGRPAPQELPATPQYDEVLNAHPDPAAADLRTQADSSGGMR